MANHKSALKRARQAAKRRLRNRSLRSEYKTEIKKFTQLVTGNKLDEAKSLLPSIHKVIDKAHTKGILAKNAASRKKSKITVLLNKAFAKD